ncbi:MAG TPA: glycosyltransferase family 39 protein [Candidatus Kapabacteria bacterium]|jgi:4-amino-4-deoxy-L-arabinose transferase-like glycosyltransferase|nr:glycosyltransferase family 39 protein [Candidatus Kapabacteria bacterium]
MLRTILLSAHSLLLDEASVAVAGRDILRNHTPMWDAYSNAPFVWIVAQLVGLRGLSDPFLLRLPSALIAAFTVIPLYVLSRRMFGPVTAIVVVFLFALHPFAVAFDRVLFADPFQTFFVICGLLGFDYYIRTFQKYENAKKRLFFIIALICVWGLAFLMKYNAVVPGIAWLAAGVVSRRYRIRPSIVCFLAMAVGAFASLALWPLDAPVWLGAFLEKGGHYNLIFSAFYFSSKLHLLFFGLTEIVLALAVLLSILRHDEEGKSIAQTVCYILIYLVTTIFLGRTFQRYFIVLAPFACLLLASLFVYGFQLARTAAHQWQRISSIIVTSAATAFFIMGAIQHYEYYWFYLQNDVDKAPVAQTAMALEQNGLQSSSPRCAFWLLPDHLGAWYLGFSQHYSRALRSGNASDNIAGPDGPLADLNYFEWQPVPFSKEVVKYTVLYIRQLAHRWSMWRILSSPKYFADSAKNIAATMRAMPSDSMDRKPAAADYLTSDLVRRGDLLVMFAGFTDVIGEPILEKIDSSQTPPYFHSLPLEKFYVYRAYGPEGISNPTDTTIDLIRAKAWILIKK